MSPSHIEARVGAFVLAALAVLVGFVLVLGDFSLAPAFRLYGDFAYTGALQVGAPVKISGIRVGRVAGLEFLAPDSKPPAAPAAAELGRSAVPVVRATLALDQSARRLLGQDARLFVGMQGVIGEAYVEITPGEQPPRGIDEDSVLRGVDAPRLHVMALQLAAMLRTLGTLLETSPTEGSTLAASLARLVNTLGELTQERRAELSQGLADAAAIAAELRALSRELRLAVGDGAGLRELVGDGRSVAALLSRDLPGIFAQAQQSLAALHTLSRELQGAVSAADAAALAARLGQTMTHLEATAKDAREMMNAVRRGQGTVGGLVTDPQVYDDLKEMMRDLKRNPWKLLWRD